MDHTACAKTLPCFPLLSWNDVKVHLDCAKLTRQRSFWKISAGYNLVLGGLVRWLHLQTLRSTHVAQAVYVEGWVCCPHVGWVRAIVNILYPSSAWPDSPPRQRCSRERYERVCLGLWRHRRSCQKVPRGCTWIAWRTPAPRVWFQSHILTICLKGIASKGMSCVCVCVWGWRCA